MPASTDRRRTTRTDILKDHKLPLGRDTGYPDKYAPDLLCPIARADSRHALGIPAALPFQGVDIWNAWDLTWLAPGNRPVVATAEIVVPADSPSIVESKSLKLYLNSFSMSSFESLPVVAATLREDVAACVGIDVQVRIMSIAANEARQIARLAGTCLDTLPAECSDADVNADRLRADARTRVSEDLYTHLLRSLCPVTAQPDIGSLQISYRGPQIDRAGLLQYVVSYREHNDFHESCVERMFVDIMERCEPETLSVYARYQRRGGIDINPFRSCGTEKPPNQRLWRQ